jgi:hypothetical protein
MGFNNEIMTVKLITLANLMSSTSADDVVFVLLRQVTIPIKIKKITPAATKMIA